MRLGPTRRLDSNRLPARSKSLRKRASAHLPVFYQSWHKLLMTFGCGNGFFAHLPGPVPSFSVEAIVTCSMGNDTPVGLEDW